MTSVGVGNARGHAQCLTAAVTMGRSATRIAYLCFVNHGGSVRSAVCMAPIAHNDYPGTPATGFDGDVLFQVGDVVYTAMGQRAQLERAFPADTLNRLTLRVCTVADYDGVVVRPG